MSTYDITPTDPLKSGFTIQPGAFDGPGGSRSNTTLRLYGRGALDWGEAVDENLVRLAETFAGATPPLNPMPGQLWMRIRYYWHDTSLAATAGWWFYNPNTKVWARLNGSGTIPAAASGNPTIGSYYTDTTTNVLYRWDTAYKQAGAAWLTRYHSASNLGGSAPTHQPEQDLVVWDQFSNSGSGKWVAPLTIATASTAPTDAQQGALWYDVSSGKLKIWTGSKWKEILGPTNGSSTLSGGDINMQTHSITNLANGTIASGNTDAVNGHTAYTYITNAVSGLGSVYLPLTGGTLTGNLTVTNNATVNALATIGNLTVTGTTNLNGTTTNVANLTIGTSINVNSHRITGVLTPTAGTDAANKDYVDTKVTSAVSGLGGITASSVSMVATGGAYKAGDVVIYGGKIYIAMSAGSGYPPGGGWKQVFPAIYS